MRFESTASRHESGALEAMDLRHEVGEELLWHGTSSADPLLICSGRDGIDFRRARIGGYYGRGAYFADSAAYSDEGFHFRHHEGRQLLLARVSCGRRCDFGKQLAEGLARPPDGFDSVRGGPHSFTQHSNALALVSAVYDRTQIYPQYIVTYRYAVVCGSFTTARNNKELAFAGFPTVSLYLVLATTLALVLALVLVLVRA